MATVLSGRFCTIQASAADKALSASISQNKGLRGWNTRNNFIGACYPQSVVDGFFDLACGKPIPCRVAQYKQGKRQWRRRLRTVFLRVKMDRYFLKKGATYTTCASAVEWMEPKRFFVLTRAGINVIACPAPSLRSQAWK